MNDARLPEVIGIGSRRCASSTVHGLLNQHPEIGKPPRGLHFFSDRYAEGPGWYRNELAPFSQKPVLLEFSVSYAYPECCLAAAQRMHSLVPDARLFLCVRNPVERVYSDYMRSLRRCEIDERLSFEQAIDRYPVFLERGRYHHIAQQYLQYYPADRLRILFYDDLVADPSNYLRSLFDYIGVDQEAEVEVPPGRGPAGNRPRSFLLSKMLLTAKRTADCLARRASLAGPWARFKQWQQPLYRRLLNLNATKAKLDDRMRGPLLQYYREDIRGLETLTGRSLHHWQ